MARRPEPRWSSPRGARRPLGMTLVGCLTLLASGCSQPCAADVPARVEIGGGDDVGLAFEAFEPGAERPLQVGPQGGAHLWMQARFFGLCPDSLVVERRVVTEGSGELLILGRGPVELVPFEEGHELSRAVRLVVCPDASGRTIDGASLRFRVLATDGEGNRAEAERSFVASCGGDPSCEAYCLP